MTLNACHLSTCYPCLSASLTNYLTTFVHTQAPTDDAFANLPCGTLDQLLLPENVKTLRKILLNHVFNEKFESSDVESGFYKALSGNKIEAIVSYDGISFDSSRKKNGKDALDSQVIQPDLDASNGIIHVIDGVLAGDVL